jgi:hypothetical protein
MLNLNKVGRPLCRIDKGKYNNMVVSVSDEPQGDRKDDDELMKEFKRLQISNDSKFQIVPDLTRATNPIYYWSERFR